MVSQATLKYPSGALRAPFVRTVLSPLTGEMPRKGQRGNYGAVTSFRRTSGVAGQQSLPRRRKVRELRFRLWGEKLRSLPFSSSPHQTR